MQAAAHQRLRHYGIAAPRPRKARRFGKRTEFDGAGLGAVYLVDAVGHVPVRDEALISRVEQQHRAALIRIIHPRLKLIPAVRRACGVVGAAQVNQVRLYICLRHGQKTVFPRGRRIHDTPSGHHIGIHIDRIHGVGHKDGIVYIEQVQDIPDVAFRTVAHKDLVLRQHNAAPGVITHQSLLQKAVALLGAIAVKGFFFAHLLHSGVQRIHHRRSQRQRHVADAKADDLLFRMLLRIDRHLLCDGGKQIAFGKVLVVFIDLQFVFPPAS